MATPPAGMEDRRGFDPRNYFKENRRAILVGASAAVMWFSGTLGSVVKIGLWIGVGLVVMMLVQQEDMLYANRIGGPLELNPPTFVSPAEHGLEFEDVTLTCDDGATTRAWFIPQPLRMRSQAWSVIYFHGNAGNIGYRLPLYRDMHRDQGVNILAVEYRGYGGVPGTPGEPGLKSDARAALTWLRARRDIDSTRVVLFGRSLGGVVSVYLASTALGRDAIAGVMLENTFTSTQDMAVALFPLLRILSPVLPYVMRSPWHEGHDWRRTCTHPFSLW